MSIGVIVEIQFTPGTEGPALTIASMTERLRSVTRSYDGCEAIHMYRDHDDPDRLLLVQRWESREKYDNYREWAMTQPGTEQILEMMVPDGMSTRYLDDTGA